MASAEAPTGSFCRRPTPAARSTCRHAPARSPWSARTRGSACNGGSAPCSSAQLRQIVDLVGYGQRQFLRGFRGGADDLEHDGGLPRDRRLRETDQNAADFCVGAPSPRNTGNAAEPVRAASLPARGDGRSGEHDRAGRHDGDLHRRGHRHARPDRAVAGEHGRRCDVGRRSRRERHDAQLHGRSRAGWQPLPGRVREHRRVRDDGLGDPQRHHATRRRQPGLRGRRQPGRPPSATTSSSSSTAGRRRSTSAAGRSSTRPLRGSTGRARTSWGRSIPAGTI